MIQINDIITFKGGMYDGLEGRVMEVTTSEDVITSRVYIPTYRTFANVSINKDYFFAKALANRKPDWRV